MFRTSSVLRVAACDLGKASAGFAIVTVGPHGQVEIESIEHRPHQGRPFAEFERWYRHHDVHQVSVLAATGIYADELDAPVVVVPEDACQEAALELESDLPDALNLISIGARGYSVLTRTADEGGRRYRYHQNEKCSSGTGENIQKITSRFGVSLEEADRLAQTARSSVAITARCSVFSKSEMTHFANQGVPIPDLLRGYFVSTARNVRALLVRNGVAGPVFLIGGCAQLEVLRSSLEEILEDQVTLPRHFLAFEALGGAALAAGHAARETLPRDPQQLVRRRAKRFATLPPARHHAHRVTLMAKETVPASALAQPSVLGLDLGSTGAKAVLTAVATGQQLCEVYDRTRGNPIDAVRRLLVSICEQVNADVRAIGITGSGREAVARLVQAVFPEAADRVIVLNEIVAHATAAIRCDTEGGQDLSIIEIGGQDAKYIRVQGGRIVASDMNKACSAGTGSFLEEQAALYDVHDIEELVRLAKVAERPPDLGQMCTVFVADAAAEALRDGYGLEDIFAGFQYSVIHNYLHRVMGPRRLGARVFFQGKPAANPTLAWTLAAVTDRDIVVPPDPGAMGAWGIGLCARDQVGVAALTAATSLSLTALLVARVTARTQFQCLDPQCQTSCPIDKTTIEVDGRTTVAISGGACPKFEVAASRSRHKLECHAPNLFERRRELLHSYSPTRPGATPIALPVTGALAGHIPYLATLIGELGYAVALVHSDATSLATGEALCNSFDACGPAKIAHAVCDVDARLILFPKIVAVADTVGPGGQTCITEQAMPDIVHQLLQARGRETRVMRPRVSFAASLDGPEIVTAFAPLMETLQVTAAQLEMAVRRAAAAQRDYESKLQQFGEEALAYARERGIPLVLVCGQLHVIHDEAINATLPSLVRQNGGLPVPVDCFPVDLEAAPFQRVYWGDANRFLRAAALARRMNDVFPLLISSFGCGPSSMTEPAFESLLGNYPHTVLESDGHGGTAGYITRIQVFLQSVRQYRRAPGRVTDNSKAAATLDRPERRGGFLDRNVRYVFLSAGDYLGDTYAACYRSFGYDAVAAAPLSRENLACGQNDCSGKECLAYQMIWGAFKEYLEQHPSDKETRLMQVTAQLCRAGMFEVHDRLSLERMGLNDRVTVSALKMSGSVDMTSLFGIGSTVIDILRQLYVYHLPVVDTEELKATYHRWCERALRIMEAPCGHGLQRVKTLRRKWRDLRSVVMEASGWCAERERRNPCASELLNVYVSGDILAKANDFANSGLFQEMAGHGLRAVVEPLGDFFDYLARRRPEVLFGKSGHRRRAALYTTLTAFIRNGLYGAVRTQHSWLPIPSVKAALNRAEQLVDSRLFGVTTMTVGNVLHAWDSGAYAGVALVSCWGCDNGLVSESLLHYRRDIPFLFVYDDGAPIDDRRVRSFAHNLRRRTPMASADANQPRALFGDATGAKRDKAVDGSEVGKAAGNR